MRRQTRRKDIIIMLNTALLKLNCNVEIVAVEKNKSLGVFTGSGLWNEWLLQQFNA